MVVRDIEIQIFVVVIITENAAHTVATIIDPRFCRDIGERAISIVAI
jgi:hypothetical protein